MVENYSTGFAMNWDEWIGKNVKIFLNDGFVKRGLFVGADSLFIEIEYGEDKKHERIGLTRITGVTEVERGE